jgi:hypothetical protein
MDADALDADALAAAVAAEEEGGAFAVDLGFARAPPGASGSVAATAQAWPPHFSDWPDGQLGGRPHWLVPARLPQPPRLRCRAEGCGRPQTLLCSVSAPVSRERCGHAGAFLRELYLFACTRARCVNVAGLAAPEAGPPLGAAAEGAAASAAASAAAAAAAAAAAGGAAAAPAPASAPALAPPRAAGPSVTVLRAQLPRLNPFYPPGYDGDEGGEDLEEERAACDAALEPAAVAAAGGGRRFGAGAAAPRDDTCLLCGCHAPSRCSRCKGPRYCSREHQALHWGNGHREACASAAAALAAGAPAPAAGGAASAVAASDATRAALLSGAVLPRWDVEVDAEPARAERVRLSEEALPEGVQRRLRDIRAGKAGALDVADEEGPGGGATAGAGDMNVVLPRGVGPRSLAAAKAALAVEAAGGSAADAAAAAEAAGGGEGEPEGEMRQLSLRGLTQKQLVAATGAALFADATLRYFQQRVACEPAQCVRYCLWPPAEDEEEEKAQGKGDVASTTAGTAVAAAAATAAAAAAAEAAAEAAAGAKDDDNDEDNDSDLETEPRGAPLWFLKEHQPPRGAVPPCSRCGAQRLFEFQLLPQALSYLLPGAKADVAATGPSGLAGVDLDFGTIAVYTCSRSCVGGAGDAADAYAQEAAWVQPAGEEQLHVPDVKDEEEGERREGGNRASQ